MKQNVTYPELWPTKPDDYSGPIIDDLTEIHDFGLGLLTADVLTIAAGGKSFGTLGEGNLKDIDGNEIPDTVTSYSSKFRRYDPDNCDPSYMVLTVIPKGDQPGTLSFTANFGEYDWKYHLDTPAPQEALVTNFRNNVDYEF